MCSCDKDIKPSKNNRTDKVKIAYSRISTPNLPPKQLEYIQESVTQFKYSLDLSNNFNFSLCSTCHSAFQRKKSAGNIAAASNSSSNVKNDKSNDDSIDLDEFDDKDECEISENFEAEQIISFNLIVKLSNGSSLPSKWLEIEVSSLDDILANIHQYVGKLTGDKDIMHSDYLVSFKPEKASGVGTQLVDIQDYKKFLLDYKNLLDRKKNMVILVSLRKKKQKQKQKRKVNVDFVFFTINLSLIFFFFFFRRSQILKNLKMEVSSCIKRRMQCQRWIIFLQFYNKKGI
jgi:hypothetical protein